MRLETMKKIVLIELTHLKTKDGKIVIFHDDYIDKKSNGLGKIEEYTYQELLE